MTKEKEYAYDIYVGEEHVGITGKLTVDDMLSLLEYFAMRGYCYIHADFDDCIVLSKTFE